MESPYRLLYTHAQMIAPNFASGHLSPKERKPLLALTLAMVAFTSCSNVTVRTDHDPQTNFAKYRTYAFGPRSQNVLALSPSVRAQIESALDQGLAAKGLIRSARPDFYVAYHVTTREQISVQQFTDWGRWGHGHPRWNSYSLWLGYPTTYSYVHRTTVGSLLVDFVDAKTDKAFWRGIASGTVGSAQSNRQKIADAVRKMLESFPPRSH